MKADGQTTEPIWIQSGDTSLLAWQHSPAGGLARGAVVICSPIGLEQKAAYTTFRHFAAALTDVGLMAIRFDYRGTGDSGGTPTADGWVEKLQADIGAVVAHARHCGAEWVGVVGMRMGATLALTALARRAASDAGDALVLWDPCDSLRSYVREQALMLATAAQVGSAPTPEGWADTSETLVPEGARVELADAEPAALGQIPVLVLKRSDRPASRKLAELGGQLRAEETDAIGQFDLLDVESTYRKVPAEAIGRIAGWLDRVAPTGRSEVKGGDVATTPALLDSYGSIGVEERCELAGHGVFSIVTERVGGSDPTLPAVVFLSVANDHRAANGRLWVDLARRLASRGFMACRFDLSGMGDSEARPGLEEQIQRHVVHFDDVIDVARMLRPSDPSDVVLVGLCASAYQAVESAAELSARGFCAINPALNFVPPESELQPGAIDPRRKFCTPPTSAYQLKDRPLVRKVRKAFPGVAWRIAHMLFGSSSSIKLLDHMARDGMQMLIVCGEREHMILRQSSPRTYDRLERRPESQMVAVPELEHHLPRWADRDMVISLVENFVAERFRGSDAGLDQPRRLGRPAARGPVPGPFDPTTSIARR